MTQFGAVLRTLTEGNVASILVGGVAATLHGSGRATFDLDVVYERTCSNIAPDFRFTALQPVSRRCSRVVDPAKLIRVKRAAGRLKDFETIAELEAIRDERGDV